MQHKKIEKLFLLLFSPWTLLKLLILVSSFWETREGASPNQIERWHQQLETWNFEYAPLSYGKQTNPTVQIPQSGKQDGVFFQTHWIKETVLAEITWLNFTHYNQNRQEKRIKSVLCILGGNSFSLTSQHAWFAGVGLSNQ